MVAMTPEDLNGFTGSTEYFKHWTKRLLYTEGVQYFAENAGGGAYWFLDICATEIMDAQATEPFIYITLDVKGDSALLTATDGDVMNLYVREIEYTDCPPGLWRFYLVNGVLHLTSEY